MKKKNKDSPPRSPKFDHEGHLEEDEGFCQGVPNGDHLKIIQTPVTPSSPIPSEMRLSPKSHANGGLTNGDPEAITIVRFNSDSTVSHAGKNGVETLPKVRAWCRGDLEFSGLRS